MPNAETAVPTDRIAWIAALLLAAGCGGGQSTDDFIPGDDGMPGPMGMANDPACRPQRRSVDEQDPELVAMRAQLTGSQSIAGRWAMASALVEQSPANEPFDGELGVEPLAGPAAHVTGCGDGVEMPVRVTLRTQDGALDEAVEGTAFFRDDGALPTRVDGSPGLRVAQVTARLQLRSRPGALSWDEDGDWVFGPAWLRAELSPFGSRGTLQVSIERRVPPKLGPNEAATSPPPSELLRWPVGAGCGGTEQGTQPRFAVSTAASPELTAAIEQVQQESYDAQYDDGTMTRVTVRIEASGQTCSDDALRLPSVAHIQTEDGRLDVSIPITIDPSYALLHFNNRSDVDWAYPPAELSARIGHIDLELDALAHVGIEAWFDKTPEPQGWLKVLGYGAGDCLLCGADGGCNECSWERRMELLGLFIGAEIGRRH